MTQIKLIKCTFCSLIFEGLDTENCPKCKQPTLRVIAVYPKLEENEQQIQIQ